MENPDRSRETGGSQERTQHPNVGGECPECGVEHDTVDSLPERALTEVEIQAVTNSDRDMLCIPTCFGRGDFIPGVPDDTWGCDEVVLVTQSECRVVTYYPDERVWVVQAEESVGELSPVVAGLRFHRRVQDDKQIRLSEAIAENGGHAEYPFEDSLQWPDGKDYLPIPE